ncbi:MAG TPA: adenylate/guanylate cyclase domain-containing protein, partial [Kiritimatiellia bacterium]
KYHAKPTPSTDKIKIILLDQASLDWGADPERGWQWPWPRQVYSYIVSFCKRSGVKALAFDVLYTEPSGIGVEDDQMFGEAARTGPPFVASLFLGKEAKQATAWPVEIARPGWTVEGLDRVAVDAEPGAAFPVPELATNAAALGGVHVTPDEDFAVRRMGFFTMFDGTAVPSLSLASLLAADPGTKLAFESGRLHVGEQSVPVDASGRAILRYRGKSGTHEHFSAQGIIQSEARILEGGEPPVSTNALSGCYVFFGFSAPGLKDLRPTPVQGNYPGVEIHATVLDNLLEGDFLRDIPRWIAMVGTIIPSLLAAWLVLVARKAWHVVIVMVVFLLLPILRGFVGYHLGYWWPVVGPELAVALSLTAAVVLNYATEGRQKRFIKSAFNQYVGEEVLDELIRDPSKLKLGGEKRVLTMFFSDLEKFSSFSERLQPPQLIELLNVYLTEMGHVLKQETGAFVDKFVGDAIVAFWNAPVLQPDHAVRAVRAAILCQRRLAEKRDEWAKQFDAVLKMRIGIGTGEVVIGNMGSEDKFNYTMLGDEANAASRLEGSNKAFGTYTMVSEATWNAAKGSIIGREVGAIRVVGRKTPVRVYEPVGLAGETPPPHLAEFEKGLAACRTGKWEDAVRIFDGLKDDKLAGVYAAKCRPLIGQPANAWDGVWNLTEK